MKAFFAKYRLINIVCLLAVTLLSYQGIADNLQITEISYKPLLGGLENENLEFIEIYNADNKQINLGGYRLTEAVNFTFPNNYILLADSYVLLVKDISQHPAGVNDKFEWDSGTLSNTGETIKILDGSGQTVSRITYGVNDPWPIPTNIHHYSIELKTGATDYSDPVNWELSKRYGGTPGYQNGANPVADISLNEFMAKNDSYLSDEHGFYPDWIEVYNSGNTAQNVAGLFISNDHNQRGLVQIPETDYDLTTILPGGYLLFWADDEPDRGILHLDFRLPSQGGKVLLSRKSGNNYILIDHITYLALSPDQSFGRYPNGPHGDLVTFVEPTPFMENEMLVFEPITGLYINEIVSKHKTIYPDASGVCSDWIEIYNSNSTPVDMGGLYITDVLSYLKKWQIPRGNRNQTTIPPYGYVVLRADHHPELGPLHLDLELSSKGENIAIVQKTPDELVIIDHWSFDELPYDVSYGRYPDGHGELNLLSVPTPGTANKREFDLVDGLYINEFMANNLSVNVDGSGNFSDWIEIYNASDMPIDMGGLYLTDVLLDPFKHMIPANQPQLTTIQPKGFLVFTANSNADMGPLYLDFKLASMGESIGIYQNMAGNAEMIDSKTFPRQNDKISLGRYSDGTGDWEYMDIPSPGAANVMGSGTGGTGGTGGSDPDIEDPVFTGVVAAVYPNPFIEDVTLKIGLEESTQVRISVLDYIGRTIWMAPLSGTFFAKGEHTYTGIPEIINAAEGIYFLRVIYGDNAIVKRFIKLRYDN